MPQHKKKFVRPIRFPITEDVYKRQGLMGAPIEGPGPTPYFLIDEERLIHNLEILKDVANRSGCKILLAQKAFSMFSVYPLIKKYLAGTAASGLYEARLGCEEMGGETHVFSPAYREDEFEELLQFCLLYTSRCV